MEKKYLEMGKITNTHGIRGEVTAQSWGDYEDDLVDFDYFYVGKNKTKMEVEHARPHKHVVLIKFKGVDDCNAAEALKNQLLYMDRDEMEELEDGCYYIADLEGITAYLEDGRVLGKVTQVMQTGANEVFVIKNESGKEYLVPFIQDCVKDVDIEQKRCTITPLEGLFDDEV